MEQENRARMNTVQKEHEIKMDKNKLHIKNFKKEVHEP